MRFYTDVSSHQTIVCIKPRLRAEFKLRVKFQVWAKPNDFSYLG